MGSLISQIGTVIAMNVRSIPRRLWMSLAAIFAVAVVVAVLLSFLAMANGFEQTLKGTGSESIGMVSRVGSRSELNSTISKESVDLLATAPGIAKDANGNPIYSAELYVIVDGVKRSTQTDVNLPLRGLSQAGLDLRGNVEIVEGRMFSTGQTEIIVGRSVQKEFSGFELGKTVSFGKTQWTVVGVFSSGGSAFESELWADALTLQSQFRRGTTYQTVRLKLAESGNVKSIEKMVEEDPRLNLDVETEADYFAEQGSALKGIVYFGWGLSIIMALGALAGALNTMYTSVANRATEIATLRAIGFSNISAFFGTLAESVVLSVIGGIIGATVAYLFIDGVTASTLGASFSQVVFNFELSPELFRRGIIMALIIGLVGGFFPAWSAARLPVVKAFQQGA